MLVGGIWALVSRRGSILSGVRSDLAQYRRSAAKPPDHIEQDMPMPFVLAGITLFVIPIFVLYLVIVDSLGVALAMTVTVVATGFLFSAVAAYMSGPVGASNNPASGITIATILFSAVLLVWLLGRDAQAGPVAAILIGAAAISGDNLQDLKAGHPVGATPWRQQTMQAVDVVCAVLLMAPILNLLLDACEALPNPLAAPQAALMASGARGVFGGGLPWAMVFVGAGIGAPIIVVDKVLKHRGRDARRCLPCRLPSAAS